MWYATCRAKSMTNPKFIKREKTQVEKTPVGMTYLLVFAVMFEFVIATIDSFIIWYEKHTTRKRVAMVLTFSRKPGQ